MNATGWPALPASRNVLQAGGLLLSVMGLFVGINPYLGTTL